MCSNKCRALFPRLNEDAFLAKVLNTRLEPLYRQKSPHSLCERQSVPPTSQRESFARRLSTFNFLLCARHCGPQLKNGRARDQPTAPRTLLRAEHCDRLARAWAALGELGRGIGADTAEQRGQAQPT